MRSSRRLIPEACLGILVAMLSVSPGFSATCGEHFFDEVTVSATSVAFGTYLPTSGSSAASNGTITVSCTRWSDKLPSFTVALSTGTASGYNPRHMMSGSDQLDYNLYTNSAHTIVWGDGSGGSVTQSDSRPGHESSVSFTSYGQIPASQQAAAGNFTDTITVTITY